MYNFDISITGWLRTHSNGNLLFLNLNNVIRIQSVIDSNDQEMPYSIIFELPSVTIKGENQIGHFGFSNPLIFKYTSHQKDLWEELQEKLKLYTNI